VLRNAGLLRVSSATKAAADSMRRAARLQMCQVRHGGYVVTGLTLSVALLVLVAIVAIGSGGER